MDERERVEGIVLIPRPTENHLNERQYVAYKSHREKLIKWLTQRGKDPDKLQGYAYHTARNYASVLDVFHRGVWDQNGSFTLDLDHDDADDHLEELILSDEDYSSSHLESVQNAMKAYFRFQGNEWETDLTIGTTSGVSQPKDYVTVDERKALSAAESRCHWSFQFATQRDDRYVRLPAIRPDNWITEGCRKVSERAREDEEYAEELK